MKELELMLSGNLYIAQDKEIQELVMRKHRFLDAFNSTESGDYQTRSELVKGIFKSVGKNAYINKPFYCDFGSNITIGDNFYANFDCVFLDVNEIIIGDNVFMAPRVSLFTAGHPIDKDIRNEQLEYGYPIKIGNDVWIGGNVVVNPGVTIGDNVVIGSGSIVTKDIPSNVIAVGNPCRILRNITEADKKYWQNEKEKYLRLKNEHK